LQNLIFDFVAAVINSARSGDGRILYGSSNIPDVSHRRLLRPLQRRSGRPQQRRRQIGWLTRRPRRRSRCQCAAGHAILPRGLASGEGQSHCGYDEHFLHHILLSI
jgi:hypothetical protein